MSQASLRKKLCLYETNIIKNMAGYHQRIITAEV